MLFRHYCVLPVAFSCSFLSGTLLAKDGDYFAPFQAAEFTPSQTDFGGVGLMQMPTGRMAEEGNFSFGYNTNNDYQFYTLSLQLMPWLETTVRYTQVNDLLYSNSEEFSGDTKLADKGIDAKIRLWQESYWLPEVSVGMRDLGGTGLFDGEYVAATKRFSTEKLGQFDLTLGMGWGYLGTRGNVTNPLCSVGDRFCDRISGFEGNGGSFDVQRWFTGSAALYGGIEYQTPYSPLRLKLEYDGNDYSQDAPVTRGSADLTPDSPWNIGALYRFDNGADLKLSYERGNTWTLGFNFSTNFNHLPTNWLDELEADSQVEPASTLNDVNWQSLGAELYSVAGYAPRAVYQEDDTVTLVTKQSKYRDRDLAAEKAASVLSNHLPEGVENYQLVEEENGLPVKSTIISAEAYENFAQVNYIAPKIADALTEVDPEIISSEPLYEDFDHFRYGFAPHLSQAFGNPESFYLYNIGIKGNASYWFNPNLTLSSSVYINLLDNYDQLNYVAPSDGTSNYRVRTLVRAYVSENDAYLTNLQLTWFQKYGQNWYQQFYGGYLETMFAGVGSEVLYRRPNSNWAIGADVNLISQRDPNEVFGTFSSEDAYGNDTKVLAKGSTGHLSLYYMPDWSLFEDTLFRLDMGKFLAADVGARLDFSKQFDSGVIVGAYASITDMSAEEFGEGSFTKGFYLSIPFDSLSVRPSNTRANIGWQPITRDGGQKLGKKYSLFGLTDPVSPWYQRPNQN